MVVKAQELSFKNYTIENGLSSNFLYQVKQDKKGFIWVCGEAGVSRFDGQKFVNYTTDNGLPDNEVLKLYEDSKGRMWFITLKGILGHIENGVIHRDEALNKLINDKVATFAEDCNGDLLVGSFNKGLLRIRNGEILNINLVKQKLDSLVFPSTYSFANDIYPNCINQQIVSIQNRNRLTVINKNGRINEIITDIPKDAAVRDFLIGDKYLIEVFQYLTFNSEKWIKSINLIDTSTKNIIRHKDVSYNAINHMVLKNDKSLWVGTVNGLYIFDNYDNKFKLRKKILNNKRISRIIEDSQGVTWVSTLSDGLFMIASDKIQIFNQKVNDYNNIITALNNNKNSIFAGFDNGSMFKIKSSKFEQIKIQPIKSLGANVHDRVTSIIIENPDKLWVARDHGLFRINLTTGNVKSFDVWTLKNIYSNSNSELLTAGYNGVLRIKNEQFNKIFLSNGRTTAVYEDNKGTIWFSNESGFCSYAEGKIVNHAKEDPLLSERVVFIRGDNKGNLWLATQGKGLLRYNNKKVFPISTKNGLASDICNSFYPDGDSLLWVATNGGISKIRFLKNDVSNFTVQNIGVRQGMVSDKISSITKLGNIIYAGTNKGLCYFNEYDVQINTSPPPTYITGIKIWDKDTSVLDKYELNHTENNIKIDYVGLSYKSLGNIKYLYKMEGIDSNWIATGYSSASFPSLPPGEYTFMVKTINEDGIESIKPASVSIFIKSPFWETWWFWLAMASLAAIIFALLFRNSIKTISQQNELKQKALKAEQMALRAQMNPHFMFNALNSIQSLVVDNNILLANEYLSKFGNLMRHILDNSRNTFISIENEIETLELYIEIEALRFNKSFEYSIDVDESIDRYNAEIPTMIIQPYIENAIWHGLLHSNKKGILKINMKKNIDKIICTIEDNGIGRKKSEEISNNSQAKKHKSLGMEITETRLSNINETYHSNYSTEIIDLYDGENGEASGTLIKITFG